MSQILFAHVHIYNVMDFYTATSPRVLTKILPVQECIRDSCFYTVGCQADANNIHEATKLRRYNVLRNTAFFAHSRHS